jgi:hypothetical protein
MTGLQLVSVTATDDIKAYILSQLMKEYVEDKNREMKFFGILRCYVTRNFVMKKRACCSVRIVKCRRLWWAGHVA